MRGAAASEVLANGEVLVIGGLSSPAELRSCEIYDPATQGFRATGFLVHPRNTSATVALRDGRVLVLGSSNALYDLVEQGSGWSYSVRP